MMLLLLYCAFKAKDPPCLSAVNLPRSALFCRGAIILDKIKGSVYPTEKVSISFYHKLNHNSNISWNISH